MDLTELTAHLEAAENDGDWERFADLLDPDVTIVHPGIGAVVGVEANVMVMQLITAAIEDYQRTTSDLVTADGRGAFKFSITGQHTGDLPGFPATGEPVEIAGAMFFSTRNGRLHHAEELTNHDSLREMSLR